MLSGILHLRHMTKYILVIAILNILSIFLPNLHRNFIKIYLSLLQFLSRLKQILYFISETLSFRHVESSVAAMCNQEHLGDV